jgi:hypothetical protein
LIQVKSVAAVVAAVVFCSGVVLLQAQTPQTGPAPATQASQTPAKAADDEDDSFAVQPAPPLPAGMTGSNTNDPRYTLKPGMYDAGEAAFGMKHLAFVKKPGVFQLPASSPDDPAVGAMLAKMSVHVTPKMTKPVQLMIAELAFANSDFAFQGNHLFQGNFYGINIYDKAMYRCTRTCCSCQSRCPMGAWIVARRHSRRSPRSLLLHQFQQQEKKRNTRCRSRRRIVSAA